MNFSVIEHPISGFIIYYIDSPAILDDKQEPQRAAVKSHLGAVTIASVYPNETFDKASRVIVRLSSDTIVGAKVTSRVVWILRSDIIKNDDASEYTLVNSTPMQTVAELTISSVDVLAMIDGVETPVDNYHIQLRI